MVDRGPGARYPGYKRPFMTPGKGWAILIVLSLALLVQGYVCGLRVRRIQAAVKPCPEQPAPTPTSATAYPLRHPVRPGTGAGTHERGPGRAIP